MKINVGSNRIVIVFPSLGFVIKLPIVYAQSVIRQAIEEMNDKTIADELEFSVDDHMSLMWLAGKGVADNWREFIYYLRNHKLQILCPAYFSLFGLVNVAKYRSPLNMNNANFWSQMWYVTKGGVDADQHHFYSVENFGRFKNSLQILDYGSPDTRMVLSRYGQKIFEEFDSAYDRNAVSDQT